MEVGDALTLSIDSIAFGGEGVARVDQFVVFVPFVLEGETVRAKLYQRNPRYGRASLIEVLDASKQRVEAPCPYFSVCGGCVYQHMPYESQLTLKTKQLGELYKQLTQKKLPFQEPCLPSPKPSGYRTKIRLKFLHQKNNSRFGFFNYYGHHQDSPKKKIVDIEQCWIASEPLNQFLETVRDSDFRFFKEKRVRSFNLAFLEDGNGGPSQVVDNLGPNVDCQTEVLGKTFHYNRNTFFQINHSIFKPLIDFLHEKIQEHLHSQPSSGEDSSSERSFMDLYCGVGFFGILLSSLFEKLYFVEENKTSYQFLLRNLDTNDLKKKSQSILSKADKIFHWIPPKVDCVLIDPPRAGVTEAFIKQISKINPQLIIYVSCNPATQFRDLKGFELENYELFALKAFDFFPQTKHIETVAFLRPH